MHIDRSATVLVTGATGFIGRALLGELRKSGCRIKILSRPGNAAQELATEHNAELFVGELVDESIACEACKGATHIFHLASADQYADRGSVFQTNVDATKVLATQALRLSTPPRLIFLSSVAIHGDTGLETSANEQSPFNAETIYAQAKLAAEVWLQDFQCQNELPITILRSCAVVGPGDKRLLKLFRLANWRVVPIVGGGRNHYQIIHVHDLTQLMIAAAVNKKAAGQTYICGNAEVLRLRDLIALISKSSSDRSSVHTFSVPLRAAKTALGIIEWVCDALALRPVVTAARLEFFSTSHRFDVTKVEREICAEAGLKFVHSNSSALADAQRWYKNQRWL